MTPSCYLLSTSPLPPRLGPGRSFVVVDATIWMSIGGACRPTRAARRSA